MPSLFDPLPASAPSGLFAPLDPSIPHIQVPDSTQTPIASARVLYLSGQVDLLSLPDGERLWFGLNGSWYRRLDSFAYLWLFNRFWEHVGLHGMDGDQVSDEMVQVPDQFAYVKRQGIEFGSFTAGQVTEGRLAPKRWDWREGFPLSVDRLYFA